MRIGSGQFQGLKSRISPQLQDQLEPVAYERDGGDLQSRGLYLDARPWQSAIFVLTRKARVGNPKS